MIGSLKPRRVTVAAVVVVGVAAAVVATLAAQRAGSDPGGLSAANLGRPAELPPRAAAQLAATGRYSGADIFLLGRRAERTYYRLDGTSEGSCYAIGIHDALGLIKCSQSGKAESLFDLSVVERSSSDSGVRLVSVDGVAADGIAAIQVVDPEGRKVLEAPVTANIYRLASPPRVLVSEVRAVDANGATVDRIHWGP